MAQQQLNNQMHQMTNLNNLNLMPGFAGFTILNNQQAHLGQFVQPGQQSMYQIIQGQPQQVQLQNVQHLNAQYNNQFHHMQPQQFNQQNILQLQQQQNQQLTQQIQTQQIQQQQQNHQQIQHQPVQQPQIQITNNISTPASKSKGNKSKSKGNNANSKNANNNKNDEPELTKTGKKKRPKANKDGVPAPKRATTAYINFTQYYRESIKKTGRPVPKIGEFGKECAGKWNSMNEEEKKPFTEEAERDRERYRKEMETFKPSRDELKPKRPGTAFMLFMVDFRKEVAGKEPEGGVAALAKLGGERWRSMTDKDKKPYVEQQNECKIIYEQKMEEYRKTTGQTTGKPNNSSSKTNSISVKSEDSNASEQLNNSLSNSNISNNVDQLNNHDESHHSPGESTSPHNLAQQALSPESLPSITTNLTTVSQLQSQQFYTNTNSFMPATFLDQHEDGSYSQNIDEQLQVHNQDEQNDQQAYLQNGQQTYQHYGWN